MRRRRSIVPSILGKYSRRAGLNQDAFVICMEMQSGRMLEPHPHERLGAMRVRHQARPGGGKFRLA